VRALAKIPSFPQRLASPAGRGASGMAAVGEWVEEAPANPGRVSRTRVANAATRATLRPGRGGRRAKGVGRWRTGSSLMDRWGNPRA
jgi:hypothetical protein